jgi:polyisoprenoid-binding protein YceI
MRFPKVTLPLSIVFFYIGLASAQPAPTAPGVALSYAVASGESTISYDVVHKLHKVRGISKKVDGKARILPDGKVQVMVRVPVESFDSSNVNRDEHMKETVEAARFPQVELKALADGFTMPTTFPATVDKTFKVQLSFHGIAKAMDVPVRLVFDSADHVKAHASMSVSFDEFKIERPSLMFVKVDDAIKIEADIVLSKG